MAIFKSYRDESPKNYGTTAEKLLFEQVLTGCLQRIADSTEAMAKNHNDLLRDLKWTRESRDYQQKRAEKAERSINTYKGLVTKLKKQIKALKDGNNQHGAVQSAKDKA